MPVKKFKAAIKEKYSKVSTTAAALSADLSQFAADSPFIQSMNENFTSAVSKAMDSDYIGNIGELVEGIKMSANNHRILEGGHTVSESLSRAFEVGEKEGLSNMETFVEWAKAYVTDLSSNAGMPLSSASDEIYGFLRNIGVSEQAARDLVTINGTEALEAMLSGSIAAVALVFAWKTKDKEAFSKSIGALGLGAVVGINPVSLMVVVVALAIGYNKVLAKEGVKRGALLSGVAMTTSALIPGPLLLGAIPALVLTIYINKHLDKNVPLKDQAQKLIVFLKSKEFKELTKTKLQTIDARIKSTLKDYEVKKQAA